MKPSHKYGIAILIVANCLVQVFYWVYFRHQIEALYNAENPSGFWAKIVEIFYPRFFVEKYRYNLPFFFQKTEQILWRGATISTLIIGYLVFYKKSIFESNFWKVEVSRKKVVFLQIILAVGWIYESFTWYRSLLKLSYLRELYEPYFLLRFIAFPNEEQVFYWFAALYLGFLLSFIPQIASYFWTLSVAVLIILLGFLYGFTKIDHTYATWLYVSMLLPFLLKNQKIVEAWALRLMQSVVAMVYLQAGLEKHLISGWAWFLPQTLQSHLQAHPTEWGLQIAASPILCVLGSFLMIAFQLGFVSILFFPRLKYLFLIGGILFHISTFMLMDIGGLISFWYLIYIIWLLGEQSETNSSQILS
jgi:hypothetical protein